MNYAELIGVVIYPLVLALQLPHSLSALVKEKQDGLFRLQLNMGVTRLAYLLSSCCFTLFSYASTVTVLWLTGSALGLKLFSDTDTMVLGLFLLGWGFSLAALVLLFSRCLTDSRVASLFGYTAILVGHSICLLFTTFIFSGNIGGFELGTTQPMPWWLFIYPQMALNRGLVLLGGACSENACIQWGGLSSSPELIACIYALYIDACWILCLVALLDSRCHLKDLVSVSAMWRELKHSIHSLTHTLLSPAESPQHSNFLPLKDLSSITPVASESKAPVARSDGGDGGDEAIVCLKGVSKRYPGAHGQALCDLTLDVRRGETLGLLGQNGTI